MNFLQKRSVTKKLNILAPYFTKKESVLDFGCGDFTLSKGLKEKNKALTITGIDVVNSPHVPNGMKFVKYDGRKLPFEDGTFDTVISFYVLHHCHSVEYSFSECVRVSRKRVVLVESVARKNAELPFMAMVDWLYNAFKKDKPPLTYQFLTRKKWLQVFKKLKVKVASCKEVSIMPQPSFFPIGRSYIYELRKK